MESSKLSISELRQYLKDANSYDSTLNNKEMYDLYKALELSKGTAAEDDEYNKTMDETDNNCRMLEDLRKNSVPVEDLVFDSGKNSPDLFDNDEDFAVSLGQAQENTKHSTPRPSSSTVVFADSTRNITPHLNADRYDFNEMDICNPIATSHKPLNKIQVNPIYEPPFYCRPEILALDYCERERLIGEFHSKLLRDFNYYQRLSIYYAPSGKPIQPNSNFNGSLDRRLIKPNNDDWPADISDVESDLESSFQLYTSRSGRQTKLKMYSEDRNDEPIKKSDSNISSTTSTTTSSDFSIKKRLNSKVLQNNEIMKRSKLFRESDTRCDKLFDKLLEERPKKIQEEEETQAFINSLDSHSDEENLTEANSKRGYSKAQTASSLLKNAKPTNSKCGDGSDSENYHKSTKRKMLTDDLDMENAVQRDNSIASDMPLRKRPNLRALKNVNTARRGIASTRFSSRTKGGKTFEEEAILLEKELEMESFINSPSSDSSAEDEFQKNTYRSGKNVNTTKTVLEHSKPASSTSLHPKKVINKSESETEIISSSDVKIDKDEVDSDNPEIVSVREPFQRRRIEPPKRPVARNKPTKKRGTGGKNPIRNACPICNKYFDQEELQIHASSCCDTLGIPNTVTTRRKGNETPKIACEICDTVLLLDTNYEVHVAECVKKHGKKL